MLPTSHSRRQVLAVLLVASLIGSPCLIAFEDAPAANPRAIETVIHDVALRDGGVLTTRIVDLQGNPVVGEEVTIEFQGRVIATSTSNDDGLVAIRGLRPGLHSISTSTTMSACRFWDADTAPPSALTLPAVVADAEIIRGQFGGFNLPQVVVLGTAIAALLIAVDAENDSEDAQDAAAALAARVEALENASP